MPARALVEMYWPTLRPAPLRRGKHTSLTWTDLISGIVYCSSRVMSASLRSSECFFVMPLTIMKRNEGVASCDAASLDVDAPLP